MFVILSEGNYPLRVWLQQNITDCLNVIGRMSAFYVLCSSVKKSVFSDVGQTCIPSLQQYLPPGSCHRMHKVSAASELGLSDDLWDPTRIIGTGNLHMNVKAAAVCDKVSVHDR